jgi:hypothetical protein
VLTGALAAIEASELAAMIGSETVYPLVSALHLMGIVMLIGSILPVDLRLVRVLDEQMDAAVPTLVRLALLGFALAVISGGLLASVRLSEYLRNPAFLTKIGFIVAAGLNLAIFRRSIGAAALMLPSDKERAATAGGASLLFWVGALLAGRWIAFA